MTVSQKLTKKFTEFPISKFKVKSKSELGKFHIVEVFKDGRLECNCPRSVYKKGECRHRKIVKAHIENAKFKTNTQ